jgi:hypothetical protein
MTFEEPKLGDGAGQSEQPEQPGAGDGAGQSEQPEQPGAKSELPLVDGKGGRRRRRGSKKYNPWLAHVKETMRKNRGVSFKNVLKLAKKSFKSSKYGSKSKSLSHSHSHSQSAGRRRGKRGGNKSSKSSQNGGSGMAGKAPFGENAAPVV